MYITIVELPEYIRRAERLLNEEERNRLIFYLSTHPKSGVLMQGTGGIRKLRWARGGKGKSGGVRVIYLFRDEEMPLFLLTIFGKGEKSNLSPSECNELAKLAKLLIAPSKRKK
ncbi:type II toxin-antitoxin system RelE/ParE family toxin [Candidatus Poribacteria bacterium]|nr:type II toxin-antitoxin system RelE/ParE family toxin [Candidatus Poribacteria bacterium]